MAETRSSKRTPDADWTIAYPDIADAYSRFLQAAAADDVLEPKVRELVLLAVNASTTTLHLPAIRQHTREALRKGATRFEVVEVLQLVSVLGMHTAYAGLPALFEALQDGGEINRAELDGRQQAIKERFVAAHGHWIDELEMMVRLDPDLIEVYTDFSSLPWRTGTLPRAVKEMIYLAIDASVTHMAMAGARNHIRRALEAGATAQQLASVLALTSTIGFHSLTAGLDILDELSG